MLPKQIEAWGAYIDTSASEAQHQVYKGVANKNFDAYVSSPSWSKAVLDRMFCPCFEQLQTHFDSRAQICSGKEQKVMWGQQTLRTFKEVQWNGLRWKPGDFQLQPFPGMVARCCVSSADKPFLLLEEYVMEQKARFQCGLSQHRQGAKLAGHISLQTGFLVAHRKRTVC